MIWVKKVPITSTETRSSRNLAVENRKFVDFIFKFSLSNNVSLILRIVLYVFNWRKPIIFGFNALGVP